MKAKSTADYIKLGLIPLLLGVLYCVIPNQNKESSTSESAKQSVATSNASAQGETNSTSPGIDKTPKMDWPTVRSQDFVDLDPFDRRMIIPEIMVSTETAENASPELLVSSLARPEREPLKIQAVFESPKGIVAIVDDRVIQIGDQLEDGSKVIDITRDQIVVARSEIE